MALEGSSSWSGGARAHPASDDLHVLGQGRWHPDLHSSSAPRTEVLGRLEEGLSAGALAVLAGGAQRLGRTRSAMRVLLAVQGPGS